MIAVTHPERVSSSQLTARMSRAPLWVACHWRLRLYFLYGRCEVCGGILFIQN